MSTHEVTSPLPGTYYSRESPTSDPFVQVGTKVAAGDTVALVEVMKMFTPVTAEVAGTVTEIRLENEDPVDVGDVIVTIEED